jgi:hypothetical protein
MEERRRCSRFETKLSAYYFFDKNNGSSHECTVVDVSREGMGIKFNRSRKIEIGATLYLTISVPTEGMLISVKGIIRQLREQAGDYFGGIEWVMVNRNKNTHSLIS